MTTEVDPQSEARALIPFTGFYPLDPTSGAFLMVDTHFTWAAVAGGLPVQEYFATITVSPDGLTSNKFEVGSGCTFDGGTLTIDGPGAVAARLTLTTESGVNQAGGVLNGATVNGEASFAPTQLSLWNGTYYSQGAEGGSGVLRYDYVPTLQIDADGTVLFAQPGGELQPAASYWYDFGMFVIGVPLAGGGSQLFEMGVTSGWGRVAGNADTGVMLVNMRLDQPAPHL